MLFREGVVIHSEEHLSREVEEFREGVVIHSEEHLLHVAALGEGETGALLRRIQRPKVEIFFTEEEC
jgi:hypothetical protein